jgi:DNA-binding NarL/FixJ family response regulator
MVSDYPSMCDAVEGGNYALVIADLSMPCPSSETVIDVLKRLNPQLRVVILSLHDDPVIASECLAAGVRGFVLKRTAVTDLVPAVEAVLGGDVYVSPALSKAKRP